MGFPAQYAIDKGYSRHVSIPNRDLWVFRRRKLASDYLYRMFQSLIGIYGFSGFS